MQDYLKFKQPEADRNKTVNGPMSGAGQFSSSPGFVPKSSDQHPSSARSGPDSGFQQRQTPPALLPVPRAQSQPGSGPQAQMRPGPGPQPQQGPGPQAPMRPGPQPQQGPGPQAPMRPGSGPQQAPMRPGSGPQQAPMRPATGPQTPPGSAMPPAVRPASAMQPQYGPGPAAQPRFAPNSYPDLAPEPEGKNNVGLIIGVVFLLVLILGGGAYWWFSGKTPDVTVYSVGNQNAPQAISGGGLIYPKNQATISYPVAERVLNVMVKPGDQVTAKQPLIQLDPAQLNAQIQQAQGSVDAAQANYNTILATGTAVNIANAQQQLANAKNVLAVLQSQSNSAFINNGNLLATMAGTITQVNINPGEVFNADTPLITIMDETTLVVHAKIPLANLGMVKLNEPAVVTASALPGVNIQGTVSSIIPQADPQTDTFEVWVQFDNTKAKLNFVPGMSAFVHVQSPGQAEVLPRLAVLNPDNTDSTAYVFVVKDDQRAHLQRVQVVGRSEHTVYIGSGLGAGDKVVLVGQDKLQDGDKVKVKKTESNITTL